MAETTEKLKFERKDKASWTEESSRSDDNCKSNDSKDGDKCCWWPIVAFIIIFIIIAICAGCSDHTKEHRSHWIAGFLFFFIIWILVLWFFCKSGNLFAAWFFFLLFIAILLVCLVAKFLTGVC